jgi:hypothetical protein
VLSYARITHGANIYPNLDISETNRFLELFENHVYIACFGDDNILSVGEPIMDYVNQNELTESFNAFGFKYTMETKDDQVVPNFRNISQVSFLKRAFRYEKSVSRYVAPLELKVILEMCQWTKKQDVNFDFVKDNVQNALYELSAHGPDTYFTWAPKIIGAARKKLNYVPKHTDFTDCLAMQVDRENFDNC